MGRGQPIKTSATPVTRTNLGRLCISSTALQQLPIAVRLGLLDNVPFVQGRAAIWAGSEPGMGRPRAFRAGRWLAHDFPVFSSIADVDLGDSGFDILCRQARLLTQQFPQALGNDREPVYLGFQAEHLAMKPFGVVSGGLFCGFGGSVGLTDSSLLKEVPEHFVPNDCLIDAA